MTFEVRWTQTSLKSLKNLDRPVQARIVKRLEELVLAADPSGQVKRLAGVNLYSLRVGDYRVILSIERKQMVVFVIEVGHRSKIYRKL
jgi:mRNA interferase RelE/StbE